MILSNDTKIVCDALFLLVMDISEFHGLHGLSGLFRSCCSMTNFFIHIHLFRLCSKDKLIVHSIMMIPFTVGHRNI